MRDGSCETILAAVGNREENDFAAKPPVAGLSGRFLWALVQSVADLETKSCSNVLHQRGNLHELDGRAYTIETGYSLEKVTGEERFGCVL